jgi:STE24 endopeptidase
MFDTASFTLLFVAAVGMTATLRVWLGLRQMRFVSLHRSAVPAEFVATISLTDHQKAADYSIAKTRLALTDLAVETALLLALTLGGLLQWMSNFWQGVFVSGSYSHSLALFASFAILSFVVELPFSLYRTFVVEARFGFNQMTAATYALDVVKGALVGVVIGAPLLLAALWLMTDTGPYWWFWLWIFWLAFNLLAQVLYPTVIAPLFNKFVPLADGQLRQRIEALLQRCGFALSGLFVMDGSKRSSHGNAYFTGFGRQKRIVFFDTLLERLSADEIEAVLAHELGHFRKHHVWKRLAFVAAASLGLLWLLDRLMHESWFYAGLGVHGGGAGIALLLFLVIAPVFGFPLAPLLSWMSRRHEYEADAYAAGQTRSGDLISALVKLYRDNAATLTPDPVHSRFYDSHPPASLRIAHLQSI